MPIVSALLDSAASASSSPPRSRSAHAGLQICAAEVHAGAWLLDAEMKKTRGAFRLDGSLLPRLRRTARMSCI